MVHSDLESLAPVATLPGEAAEPAPGIAFCLSGGGYRAMLFHTGAVLRLVEVGLFHAKRAPFGGEFGKLERVSSVSGGSITAAVLAEAIGVIRADESTARAEYIENVVERICALAGHTIDIRAVLVSLLPFASARGSIVKAYRKHLFGRRTLDEFPNDVRFVINATNLSSGALWRFMKPYTRDWKVGKIPRERKTFQTAVAVAASSAFPPFLSPARLKLKSSDYEPGTGGVDENHLQRLPYTTKPVLSDGGVYDNLGLETAWKNYKTILVSDGGGKMKPTPRVMSNWPLQALRVLNVIDDQVRNLRKRQLIESYKQRFRTGAYWGIRTNIEHYELTDALDCPVDKTIKLAEIATRLKRMSPLIQQRLINWGYAVCDAAIRKHVYPHASAPKDFPYPGAGVG